MAQSGWSHYEHQADVGIRAFGPTLEETLVQAALGLTAVITEPEAVVPQDPVPIEVSAPDPEFLLVEWLDALVYEMATRSMLFGAFEVSLTEEGLAATAWGEPVDRARHQPAVEVKGATLTDLRVARTEAGTWTAQCVVDV
ncbi:archease [Thiohalorhabdus denitrificans]|uniref:SHS2 domain-containing protein n=1 Tax=Thiohalorhabdus denitrificans TaxID=381306 RepID=A0A0P9CM28_9GAMM|nr:archease [Thiohalorhabdus denitrificans]KPV40124.1 archease [Thiohalorhabdus denitrificans]SCY16761.1 SHS2 domain-containing protein [Thiohalorhabdus denitrificans]